MHVFVSTTGRNHAKMAHCLFNYHENLFKLRPSSSKNTSVRPSVRPSVTPFSQCSCHRIIMKYSGDITTNQRDVHAKGQGQRSRSQRSKQILPQFGRFQTVTRV